jgi:CBS domain-containing protein
MSANVASVSSNISAAEIAKLMRDKHIGCVPVVENDHLIGMITDRDITCRVVAAGRSAGSTTAGEIMSKDMSVCYEDDFLADAAHIMERDQVRRLPVVDREKRIVGILTADDLSWHTDHLLLGEVIETVYEHHG